MCEHYPNPFPWIGGDVICNRDDCKECAEKSGKVVDLQEYKDNGRRDLLLRKLRRDGFTD